MADEIEGQEPETQELEVQEDPSAAWEAERAQMAQQLQAERQQREQLASRYQQDVGTLSAYVQSFQQQPTPPVEEEIDEETPEGRKRAREQLQRQLQESQQAHQQSQYQALREMSRNTTAMKHGAEWDKYGAEVEQMLNQYPLAVTATPQAYDAAMKAVKALHYEEILEEAVAKRLAARSEEEEDDGDQRAPTSYSPPTMGGVSPVRTTASPGRAVAPPKKRARGPWDGLDREQQQWLKERGMSAEDYNKYSDPKYEHDFMGFKGRHVIGDEDFSAYSRR